MSFNPDVPLLVGADESTLKRARTIPKGNALPFNHEPTTSRERVAYRCRRLRGILFMGQRDTFRKLAKVLNISVLTLMSWEHLLRTPSLKHQIKLRELEAKYQGYIDRYEAERERIFSAYPEFRPEPPKPVEKPVEKLKTPRPTAKRYFPASSTNRKSFLRESTTRN